jgi:hypothetical protein
MTEPLYRCRTCGCTWHEYETHGPADDRRCNDVTCGGSCEVVEEERES